MSLSSVLFAWALYSPLQLAIKANNRRRMKRPASTYCLRMAFAISSTFDGKRPAIKEVMIRQIFFHFLVYSNKIIKNKMNLDNMSGMAPLSDCQWQ